MFNHLAKSFNLISSGTELSFAFNRLKYYSLFYFRSNLMFLNKAEVQRSHRKRRVYFRVAFRLMKSSVSNSSVILFFADFFSTIFLVI
jgi:hypothetical protein